MFCRNCGSELKNNDQFCCNCGFSAGDNSPAPVPVAPKKKLSTIQITILSMSAVLVLVILVCVITMATNGIFSPQELSTEPVPLDTLPVEAAPENPVPEGNPYHQCYNTTEYILSESNTRYYAPAELSQLTDEELMVAQAEISARQGQTVTDPQLREYFDSLSWYTPGKIAKLNTYEEENLFLIDVCLRLRDGSLYRSSNPYMGYLNQSTAYVLPNSDTRSVSGYELNRMSTSELFLARNEIYARHGYIFQDSTLKEYFCCKDWYQPTTLAKDFSDTVFCEQESNNLNLILVYENLSGSATPSSNNPYMPYYRRGYEYIFSDSSSRILNEWDIMGLSIPELIIARNEIFARNGYTFTDDHLMQYFLQCSWYLPQYPAGRLDLVSLNSTERANVNFLLEYQNFLEDNMRGSASGSNVW